MKSSLPVINLNYPNVNGSELPDCLNMKNLNLKAPAVEAILSGIVIAILLFLSPVPPGFAIVVGIIFGVVAFFVLNKGRKV